MINAQVNLIVPIFIPKNNKYQILSTEDYNIILPSSVIEESTDINILINVILSRYLKEVVGIIPKLTDAIVTGDSLIVYYLCFINYETQIINGVLKDINANVQTFPANAQKIISLLSK